MKKQAITLILAALLFTAQINSLLIKFDKDAADDVELREKLIAEYFPEGTDEIKGHKVRELLYKYYTGHDLATVDAEFKRLYAEGVFSDDEYSSFYSITALDFYMEKMNLINLKKSQATHMLTRQDITEDMAQHMEEFSGRMMGEVLELLNSGKMKEPTLEPGAVPEGGVLAHEGESIDPAQQQLKDEAGRDQASGWEGHDQQAAEDLAGKQAEIQDEL